jgi:hypothetical protein
MGYEEKKVRIAIDGNALVGDALLEEDEIILRVPGEPKRRKLPLSSVKKLRAADGVLSFESASSVFALTLGARAERWRTRIETPPSLLDKLGVRAGASVHVDGVEEPAFEKELAARKVVRAPLGKDASVLVLGMTKQADLKRLAATKKKMADTAALWVVWPKGKPELTEDHIRAAALATGLVDVKVARFSAALSSLKLVVPVKDRKPAK